MTAGAPAVGKELRTLVVLGHVIAFSPRQFANDPECCGLCLPLLYEASQGRVGWYGTVNWGANISGYYFHMYYRFLFLFYNTILFLQMQTEMALTPE